MTEIQEFDKNDWGYHPLPLLKKVVNRMVQDDLDKDYTSIDELFKIVNQLIVISPPFYF